MNPESFKSIAQFVNEKSGIVISADKEYLVETRLLPVAREHGLDSLDNLARALKSPSAGNLSAAVVEAMTTNETFFFRDDTPFSNLTESVIPELIRLRTGRRLRIWCAAASSGQEPYSIAMALKEMGSVLAGWNIEIVATDISSKMLEKARKATYSQFEVQRGLPVALLLKYFTQKEQAWQLSREISSMVQFRPLNLLRDFSALGSFDVVFCRNVLIYFERDVKAEILSRISRQMSPDGFLFLGAAETVVGISGAFKSTPGRRGLYMNVSEQRSVA